jgi:hypothetical protein
MQLPASAGCDTRLLAAGAILGAGWGHVERGAKRTTMLARNAGTGQGRATSRSGSGAGKTG